MIVLIIRSKIRQRVCGFQTYNSSYLTFWTSAAVPHLQLGPLQLPPDAAKRLKWIQWVMRLQNKLPKMWRNEEAMTRKKVEIYLEYSEEVGVIWRGYIIILYSFILLFIFYFAFPLRA
jgi:hypothetical protein